MTVNNYKGHAVNITMYDISGAPLPPAMVTSLVLHAEQLAHDYSVNLAVTKTDA